MIPLLLAAAIAADSTVYPVLNHDRPAGSMVVRRSGDTTDVRFVFTDRNRGTRSFVRYLTKNGSIVSTELRPVLLDDRLGDVTFRVDVGADSVRQGAPGRQSASALKPGVYYGSNLTPYDQMLLAKHLLAQRSHASA